AGIRLAGETGAPPVQFPTWRALALLNLGRYGEAWESLQQEVADDAHPFGRAMKDLGTGLYFLELMAYEKASEVLRDVVEQARRLKAAWMRHWAQGAGVGALVQAGQLDETELDRITRDLQETGATLPPAILAEIRLSQGNLEEALEAAEGLCAQAEA